MNELWGDDLHVKNKKIKSGAKVQAVRLRNLVGQVLIATQTNISDTVSGLAAGDKLLAHSDGKWKKNASTNYHTIYGEVLEKITVAGEAAVRILVHG